MYMKERIVIDTKSENKKELKRLAGKEGLTLSAYMVLKGLNKLKESK
jgi:hypothetical protein